MKIKSCAILNLTEPKDALKPLTSKRPIAALPFACRYRIIDFALSNIANAGVESCAMFISESGRSIYDHIRSGKYWGLDLTSAGGIFTFSQQNWRREYDLSHGNEYEIYEDHQLFLSKSNAEYVFVLGTQIVANVDLTAVLQFHEENKKELTVVYQNIEQKQIVGKLNEPVLVFDEGGNFSHITQHEKLETSDQDRFPVSLNMFVLTVDTLNQIFEWGYRDHVYLDTDQLILNYIEELEVSAYEFTGYTANVDSIEAYFKANMSLLEKGKFDALFHGANTVITKPKNGVPTYYDKDSLVHTSQLATECIISGQLTNSLCSRRVKVGKGSTVDHTILLQGVTVGENVQLSYCILDKQVVVDDGAVIEGSPENIVIVPKGQHVSA